MTMDKQERYDRSGQARLQAVREWSYSGLSPQFGGYARLFLDFTPDSTQPCELVQEGRQK
jgi:hypothetical protein